MITHAGRTWITSGIAGTFTDRRCSLHIGLSNTPPHESQTALGAPVANTPLLNPVVSDSDTVYSGTVMLTQGALIAEIGLFSAAPSMIARSTIVGVYLPPNIPIFVEVRLRVL